MRKGLSFLLLVTACREQDSMALLDHPQILAVRAEPPAVPAGGQARIDVLVGDTAGAVFVTAPEIMTTAIEAPLAQRDEEGWFVVAPGETELAAARAQAGLEEGAPVPVAIAVNVTVDGMALGASKTLRLGAEGSNPVVESIDAPATAAPAAESPIRVTVDGGAGELSYAWYTSIGDLDRYRSAEAAWIAPEVAGDGELLVVIRDEQGGVCWQTMAVVVE
jgi:hypothetical protein